MSNVYQIILTFPVGNSRLLCLEFPLRIIQSSFIEKMSTFVENPNRDQKTIDT